MSRNTIHICYSGTLFLCVSIFIVNYHVDQTRKETSDIQKKAILEHLLDCARSFDSNSTVSIEEVFNNSGTLRWLVSKTYDIPENQAHQIFTIERETSDNILVSELVWHENKYEYYRYQANTKTNSITLLKIPKSK